MRRRLSVLGLVALAACTETFAPFEPEPAISYPGFDTSIYPGDAAMRAWAAPVSPYEWVGYYLPAPCHRDASWVGKRATLESLGWGIAVLYVGQQTWDAELSRIGAGGTTITCSRSLLSAAQGSLEAADAASRTASEGFPRGTVIFLDAERMETIPAAYGAYYRAWIAGVLADGRFRPGVYAHRSNAPALHQAAREAYTAAGAFGEPEFWVAGGSGFSLDRDPQDVGYDFASVWQGVLDVRETWGGVTINIDANVARYRSPSSPGV